MAGITVKTLAEGQLGTTAWGVLYTVSGGKSAIVRNFRFGNREAATTRTMNLYYLKSGLTASTSARLILPAALSIAAGNIVIENNELTMAEGDQIVGNASGANVDYVISGIEREA